MRKEAGNFCIRIPSTLSIFVVKSFLHRFLLTPKILKCSMQKETASHTIHGFANKSLPVSAQTFVCSAAQALSNQREGEGAVFIEHNSLHK